MMLTTPYARYGFTVVEPPAVEPVTLNDMKAILGIPSGDTSQDARIASLIRAAREMAEAYTGRAFITQKLLLQLDRWPGGRMPWWDGVRVGSISEFIGDPSPLSLPRPPLISVESVAYRDPYGSLHTIDPTAYYLDTVTEPGRLVLSPGVFGEVRERAGFMVTYVAGYGASAALVPAQVAQAIIAHVTDAMERPNGAVSSERVDNASVTYGGSGGASAGAGTADGSGLRGDAASLLAPLRVRHVWY